MALKIVWTENAETHLEAILSYWSERNGSSLYSQNLYKIFSKVKKSTLNSRNSNFMLRQISYR